MVGEPGTACTTMGPPGAQWTASISRRTRFSQHWNLPQSMQLATKGRRGWDFSECWNDLVYQDARWKEAGRPTRLRIAIFAANLSVNPNNLRKSLVVAKSSNFAFRQSPRFLLQWVRADTSPKHTIVCQYALTRRWAFAATLNGMPFTFWPSEAC
jgi:hypothetical protein